MYAKLISLKFSHHFLLNRERSLFYSFFLYWFVLHFVLQIVFFFFKRWFFCVRRYFYIWLFFVSFAWNRNCVVSFWPVTAMEFHSEYKVVTQTQLKKKQKNLTFKQTKTNYNRLRFWLSCSHHSACCFWRAIQTKWRLFLFLFSFILFHFDAIAI